MSEYVTVEIEFSDDPLFAELFVNQRLTSGADEHYASAAAGEIGSPLAQMLFAAVDGIAALTISGDCLIIRRDAEAAWEGIIDDVRDALRDWYL